VSTGISHEQLVKTATFSGQDLEQIAHCRLDYNRLGFGYQLAYVKQLNRFPLQEPLEVIENILAHASSQLGIAREEIHRYGSRRPTITEHQEKIRHYLNLRHFSDSIAEVEDFLRKTAYGFEYMSISIARLREFLRQNNIIEPSTDTLQRVVQTQREAARTAVYGRIAGMLSEQGRRVLDAMIVTDEDDSFSPLHYLKQPPGNPCPASFNALTAKMEHIERTGLLGLDIQWLGNNFQRYLAQYAQKCSIYRLRRLKDERRYAVLTCFLHQLYQDTSDALVAMYDKLVNKLYNRADRDIEEYMKKRRKQVKAALLNYRKVLHVLLDDSIQHKEVRTKIFDQIDPEVLHEEIKEMDALLGGKYNDSFNLVVARHSYIRQFSPQLFKHLALRVDISSPASESVVEAVNLLNLMNDQGKHKLPRNAPIDFIPKRLKPFVIKNKQLHKPAWEAALLTVVRDQIKSGNLYVEHSKRFASLEEFFIPESEWQAKREKFFERAKLPANPVEAAKYLTERMNGVYDRFLQSLQNNPYVKCDKDGWKTFSDPGETLDSGKDTALDPIKAWIGKHIRTIKLPDLLIEVDNDLHFTSSFIPPGKEASVEHICEIIAAIMAYALEVGLYTLSQMIDGISYHRIKHIADWQLNEENQRSGLAVIVNAISKLDVTQHWGDGTTSSSDGQRFSLRRKVLQQTYSPVFNDFALEFYSFVADNYAPFHSMPIECADRDAPFVLDGLLHNESDLPLYEHFTDSHGFTDNNFAAFAMYGRQFTPRIKALSQHAIFCIDADKDYGALEPLLNRKERVIRMDWIIDQWDKIAHFFASLESGHVTASTALRRLNSFSPKNHFYRATRELGRIFRTEHTLNFMSDPLMRKRNRRGLLKGEQIHALARDIRYGKRGRINNRDWLEQCNSCSCLTLFIACIIYWQAKEINRIVLEHLPQDGSIDISLLQHVSPVSWENILIYGDYNLNRDKVKRP
jgi:TnpA family transposase